MAFQADPGDLGRVRGGRLVKEDERNGLTPPEARVRCQTGDKKRALDAPSFRRKEYLPLDDSCTQPGCDDEQGQ
jgi:hypothetical protein